MTGTAIRNGDTMLRLGNWEFCQKRDCRDPGQVSRQQDLFSARQWLQQFRTDVHKMLAMRTLLWQENTASSLSRMSDTEIVNQVAELLICGRLHVHVHAHAVQAASAPLPAVIEAPRLVPFPISGLKPRQQAAAYSAPPSDPPTFPSGIDAAAQAAALVAAAAGGKPFCPE